MTNTETPLDIPELARRCRSVLAKDVWDFIAGGSGTESTLAANITGLSQVYVLPRVLRDVSRCDPRSEFFGAGASMPVAIAPMAYQTLVHPDGELASASAAKEAGIPFTAATLSGHSVERIAEMGGSTWFQLYWLRDRARTLDLVRRAEDAGCGAVMLTADVPWMGRRLRDLRNQFALPGHVTAANLDGGAPSAAHDAASGGSAVAAHTRAALDPSLSWSDVDDLRERTRLPLIVKGVLHPDDAVRLVECGVDAVVVSNHGGRQLDGAAPACQALPLIRDAVGERCEVLLDSGIRSGTDVLKALALGASGVLVGRPVLWGLAVAGAAGVRQVLDLLAAEFAEALGLAGCPSVADARKLVTGQKT
ncbi:alpha-hydroxy acid oxidase [Actinokineospora sp.]|uniref:alpha-hydroxy acid oxidase n=1 Tax=Actinokineospora sp. TaxID=1872133 RepID=UPI0040384051